METEVLTALTQQLVDMLNNTLPKLSSSWWQTHVIDKLTFQQQNFVRNLPPKALNQLDLAALLRIVDQNWFELSQQASLSKDARNWLKEAMTIRNRWAHVPAGGLDDDTHYRDLDTLERLLHTFGASADILEILRQHKKTLLAQFAADTGNMPQALQKAPAGQFSLGTVVRLKAHPATTGAIITHLPSTPEDRYQVFHDGSTTTYYASQIETASPATPPKSVSPDELHALLTALQLRHPGTRHLYSLFASRIQFVPYQFRPVLKLIQSDRPRLLIADEVGVGKTIEAGLILKELQARRELQSVLIVCPKPLVAERKWLEEMKRFDERFEHLDGGALRYCLDETHLDGVWPQKYARAIVPYSLFDEALLMGKQNGKKRQKGLLDLDPPPAFDLVIVDEAHHIRNTDTYAYRTVRYFCDNAEAVVLMSATPIQLGSDDLYNLLHLLRPDVLPNRRDFDQMAEPNPHLNAAIEAARAARPDWQNAVREAIGLAIATPWGRGVLAADPRLQQACDCLTAEADDVQTRLVLVRQLEELYTFSSLINRTRRRDIGNFTIRKPETVAVEFTPEQADLHRDLISLIARILAHRHGDQNLAFMLTTVRRQIASCVFGLAPLLKNMLERKLSQLELSELGDEDSSEDIAETLAEFRADVNDLIRRAQSLSGLDPKLDAFLKVIRDKQALPNNKLLAFSSFRHTLAYLVAKLEDESVRVGLIHGDIPDDERRELRNRFKLAKEDPKALDVLLCSEVGCEGLDYQFCDGLVNYDLPWNPMRVEQRIGRIDRYGQKSETVVIYNFITPGTVDADIYERCLLRIGVFRQALGGSEEILGKLTREIRAIAENFALSPEEQAAKLQQLADNEVRAVQEQERLEQEQAKLFGLSLPKRDEEMVKQAESFWLTPARLANLITQYLEALGVNNLPASFGRKPVATLQLGQEIRDKLLADFHLLKLTGETAQAWLRWLKGNDPYLTVTFEPETADERRDVVFITPTHPLARQAAQSIKPTSPVICQLQAQADGLPPGRYLYAIYRWRKLGLKEDFLFQPVTTRPELAERMLELLETAHPLANEVPGLSHEEETALEQAHYRHWIDARAVHIELVTQTANSRLASLDTTHRARLALLEEQRDQTTESRIRRMRESQIESAKRDYERRAEDLRNAPGQADVIAEAVAFGVLEVNI
ncbi:MAG: SNF2-related protein [Methylococcaceae bacterium]|nr:SNF2-related protein [Methylococcaceae bacterium]